MDMTEFLDRPFQIGFCKCWVNQQGVEMVRFVVNEDDDTFTTSNPQIVEFFKDMKPRFAELYMNGNKVNIREVTL